VVSIPPLHQEERSFTSQALAICRKDAATPDSPPGLAIELGFIIRAAPMRPALMRSVVVQLTEQELLLFLNTIRARSLYRPCSHGAAAEIWKPWMAPLLEKLTKAAG